VSIDARESALRIVVEVFGPGEEPPSEPTPTAAEDRATGAAPVVERPEPAAERDEPVVERPEPAAERDEPVVERPVSAAEQRARELVSEVFDPPAPEPEVPRPPTPAELAGRRIAAEAEAAQRARAEERVAAAAAARQAAREAAEAQERERARLAREEWIARARAEQEAEQERARAEQLQREAEAARAAGQAPAADEPEPPSATVPAKTGQEALFEGGPDPTAVPDDHDVLFEPATAGLPASLTEDMAGPPAPPADQLPLQLAATPPAPQLAARMVSDVLEERSGRDEPVAALDGSATPMAAEEVERRQAVARWLVVTVLAAVSLAVLFPLAVRAVLQLVSLS